MTAHEPHLDAIAALLRRLIELEEDKASHLRTIAEEMAEVRRALNQIADHFASGGSPSGSPREC